MVIVDEVLTPKRSSGGIAHQIKNNTPRSVSDTLQPNYETLVRNFMNSGVYRSTPESHVVDILLDENGVFTLVHSNGREGLCGKSFMRGLVELTPYIGDLLKRRGYYEYVMSTP